MDTEEAVARGAVLEPGLAGGSFHVAIRLLRQHVSPADQREQAGPGRVQRRVSVRNSTLVVGFVLRMPRFQAIFFLFVSLREVFQNESSLFKAIAKLY